MHRDLLVVLMYTEQLLLSNLSNLQPVYIGNALMSEPAGRHAAKWNGKCACVWGGHGGGGIMQIRQA